MAYYQNKLNKNIFLLASTLQTNHALQFIQKKNELSSNTIIFIKGYKQEFPHPHITLYNNFNRIYHLASPRFTIKRYPHHGTIVDKLHKAWQALTNELGVFYARLKFVVSLLLIMLRVGKGISTVIIGDYRSVSMRQIFRFINFDKTEVVLLDDGSITPEIMVYRHDGSFREEIESRVAVHARKLVLPDPYCYKIPPSVTFFSIYNAPVGPQDRIIRNTYYEEAGEQRFLRQVDETWLCGSNHIESGIAHDSAYREACQIAKNLCPGNTLYYYPHRREVKEKSDSIASQLDARQGLSPHGLEQTILSTGVIPKTIISFGSTVLDTIPKIVKDKSECILLVPKDSYFTGKRLNHMVCVMRNNLRSHNHVAGLFCTDPNAPKRSSFAKLLEDKHGNYATSGPSNDFLLQTIPSTTIELLVYETPIYIQILPNTFTTSKEKTNKHHLALHYTPKTYSSFFSATVPVTLSITDNVIQISSSIETITVPLPLNSIKAKSLMQIKSINPITNERSILEVVELKRPIPLKAAYVLAW